LIEPPADHYFLKIFGQPQREMACQCERSNESNLSQALQMINGPVVHNKLRDAKGRIHQMVDANKSDDEIITQLYLAALCRKPVEKELEAAKKHISSNPDRKLAMEDVGWALLNSKEFLFQH
jgi:protein subunit release factor B